MTVNLYSIRMRASLRDTHLSGAERIVPLLLIKDIVSDLLGRAVSKDTLPDDIHVDIERLGDESIRFLTSLDVRTTTIHDVDAGRDRAGRMLTRLGVSTRAAAQAIRLLGSGPAPGGKNMRGAVIMDAVTAERLEPDQDRGVRASRFDWNEHALAKISIDLATAGLAHFRTREALALATKIAHAPGVIAELCWSDDPDYTAGYLAALQTGYVRFSCLKKSGDPHGGRVIFVDRAALKLDELIRYLQLEPVLITAVGSRPQEWRTDDHV